MSIKALRKLNDEADKIVLRTDPFYTTASIIESFAKHKLFPHIEKDDNLKRHFLNLKFINKGMDFINIPNILNDKNCKKHIPTYFHNVETPIISYSYDKPVRSSIFNHNKVVSDDSLDLDNFNDSCDCKDSEYCYKPVGHIITGNFKILNNLNLINIFKKGPKYRLPTSIDFVKCLKEIDISLNKFTESWCKRENTDMDALNDWKKFIFDKVKQRIEFYSTNPNLLPPNPTYSLLDLKQDLIELHQKYIFAPADKASNNIIII